MYKKGDRDVNNIVKIGGGGIKGKGFKKGSKGIQENRLKGKRRIKLKVSKWEKEEYKRKE